MMEFQISVSMDEGGLDEFFKDQLIDRIADKILDTIESQNRLRLVEAAEKTFQEKIDTIMNDLLQKWMTKEVQITNRFGDEVESGSIQKILEQRFEAFWQEVVDRNGKLAPYRNGRKRIEWLVDKQINKLAEHFSEDLAQQVENQVKTALEDRLKVRMGESIVKNLGVANLLKQIEGKTR